MRRRSLLFAVPLLALSCAVPAAFGHHGWDSYDADHVLKLKAVLEAVHYRNPHAEVNIQHAGESWLAILAPTTRMESRGLPPGALTAGKTITIEGYPRSDGSAELRAERITVDGNVIELR